MSPQHDGTDRSGIDARLRVLLVDDHADTLASLRMLLELGIRDIAEVTRGLHEPVLKWADERGVRITSPRDDEHRSAIVCVAPPKPVDAFHALKRAHVVCSLREGAIRLAPHCYNTMEEMEKVVEVLDGVI